MDEFSQPEESVVSGDDIAVLVKDAVDSTIPRDADYSTSNASEWIDIICDGVMQKLGAMKKAFKYIVTVSISRKTGAGLHFASSAFWDITTDNLFTLKDESNKNLVTLVTVYWTSI